VHGVHGLDGSQARDHDGCAPAPQQRLTHPHSIPSHLICIPSRVARLTRGASRAGISASDRAATLRALADAKTLPSDLSRPGHIFPLKAVRIRCATTPRLISPSHMGRQFARLTRDRRPRPRPPAAALTAARRAGEQVAGGVLKRDGHTEASVDLARLAGCTPAGALVEITTEVPRRPVLPVQTRGVAGGGRRRGRSAAAPAPAATGRRTGA